MNKINFEKLAHYLGILGLVLLAVLAYINQLASEDFILQPYKLWLIGMFVVVFFAHYIYLASQALAKKQWLWAGLLFIAPIPTYWIYYAWDYSKRTLFNKEN